MQVTVENVNELGRRMTIVVEDANIEQTVQERLKSIRPTVKMAGFRPGKVPMNMLERSHGPAARREVIDAIVQSSMQEAFTQEKVTPASPPHIDGLDEEGEKLTYSLVYEVYPEVNDIKLDGITVEKTVAEVTDEDVDKMIETLREQRAIWEPLKRGAKEEDGVKVDFVGSIDGEEFEGGKANNFQIIIGSGNMIPGFEEQLIGKKAGQEIVIEAKFPEDYHAENLAGKDASFAVTVNEVAKKKLPKLDKDFAIQCGVEDGVAALKKEVRANMERELSTSLKTMNKRRTLDALSDNNELELPEGPVLREAEFLMEQAKNNLKNQGVKVDGIPFSSDVFKDSAKGRVKLSLLIGKIISDNEIKPEEDLVKAHIDSIAESYEDPTEVVNYYMNNQDKLNEVQMIVVEDLVVEWIQEHVKVEESTSTFSEVVNQAQSAA
jgi:trigger factor